MSPTSRTGVSRTALTVCSTLTIHYSVLSLVLHYSRMQSSSSPNSLPYHPSTAIFLTELGKIAICLLLVARNGELKDFVKERKRIEAIWRYREIEEEERASLLREREREDEERQRERTNEAAGVGFGNPMESQSNGGGAKLHHRKNSSATLAPPPPKNHGLSINVDRARTFPNTPSLAVIPATPAPEPSPTRIPEVSLLFPHRPSREQDESTSTLDDMMDQDWWRVLKATVFRRNSFPLAVISILFVLQGQMQYIAASNLSVPLFQLAYQLKIPATAMFSTVLLNRSLSTQQWMSLFVLTTGVGIVQLCSVMAARSAPTPDEFVGEIQSDTTQLPNQFLGLSSVVLACLSSGFASCYFERILKIPSSPTTSTLPMSPTSSSNSLASCASPTLPSSSQPPPPELSSIVPARPSLWIRNVQLSSFGLGAVLPFVLYDLRHSFVALVYPRQEAIDYLGESWSSQIVDALTGVGRTFFQGFSRPVVWLVIVLQIIGGILSALVIQYADNLLKCFATSLSILMSLLASVVIFDFSLTPGITIGATLVIAATFAYTSPGGFQSAVFSPLRVMIWNRRR